MTPIKSFSELNKAMEDTERDPRLGKPIFEIQWGAGSPGHAMYNLALEDAFSAVSSALQRDFKEYWQFCPAAQKTAQEAILKLKKAAPHTHKQKED